MNHECPLCHPPAIAGLPVGTPDFVRGYITALIVALVDVPVERVCDAHTRMVHTSVLATIGTSLTDMLETN